MRIVLMEGSQRDAAALPPEMRARLMDVLLQVPLAFRDPQRHRGLGLRKLHGRDMWEARVGLDLRVVFGLGRDEIVVGKIGDHDEVDRYLRTL